MGEKRFRKRRDTAESQLDAGSLEQRLAAGLDDQLDRDQPQSLLLNLAGILAALFVGANLLQKLILLTVHANSPGFQWRMADPYLMFLATHLVVTVFWGLVLLWAWLWFQRHAEGFHRRLTAAMAEAGPELFPGEDRINKLLASLTPRDYVLRGKSRTLQHWVSRQLSPLEDYLRAGGVSGYERVTRFLKRWFIPLMIPLVLISIAEQYLFSNWFTMLGVSEIPDYPFLIFQSEPHFFILFMIFVVCGVYNLPVSQELYLHQLVLQHLADRIGYRPPNESLADVRRVVSELAKESGKQAGGFWLQSLMIIGAVFVVAFLSTGFAALRSLTGGTILVGLVIAGGVSALGISVALVFWTHFAAGRRCRELRSRLRDIPVFELLSAGRQEVGRIYNWTGWYWARWFLGPRPRTLPESVWLLARNLDWYAREPRRLVRPSWLFLVLAGGLLVTRIAWLALDIQAQGFTNFFTSHSAIFLVELLYYPLVMMQLLHHQTVLANVNVQLTKEIVDTAFTADEDGHGLIPEIVPGGTPRA